MKRPIERELVTCAEAAEILGISLQAVYQGLRNGIIGHELVLGRKMIDPDRLVQRWRGLSDQEAWAQRCNGFLDLECWGPPPWSADQWITLRNVIEMAWE